MKSMAVGCSEAKEEERTRSTLVPEVREEWRLAEMEASRPASEPRWCATRRARSVVAAMAERAAAARDLVVAVAVGRVEGMGGVDWLGG